MSKERASFTSEVVTILLAILPDHVSPAGGKTDWECVSSTLNTRTGKQFTATSVRNWFTNMKDRHKAWNEIKKWTGIGWTENGCFVVDTDGEIWKAFVKRYKSIATVFLKTPLQNEAAWDKILRSGYASGERSYTPASIAIDKHKEVVTIEDESSGDSEFVAPATKDNDNMSPILTIEPRKCKNNDAISFPSKKSSRDQEIDTCLEVLRKSSVSQSSKPPNPFDEVYEILETMGIAAKYREEFVVDILDSFRKTPGAIDLFISLRTDTGRLHFLKKHCVLDADVYKLEMSPSDDDAIFDD